MGRTSGDHTASTAEHVSTLRDGSFQNTFFGFVRKVVGTLHGSDVKTHCLDIAGFWDFKILKYKYSENHKSFVMSLNLP